jgi:hypothetical protein
VANFTLRVLYPLERKPNSIEWETGQTSDPVWKFWKTKIPFAREIRNPDGPSDTEKE